MPSPSWQEPFTIHFENEPGRVQFNLPALGQHSEVILRELGYAESEIARLRGMAIFTGTCKLPLAAADEHAE